MNKQNNNGGVPKIQGGKLALPGVDGASVRVAPDGRVSVYDFIGVRLGWGNPRMAWRCWCKRYPELLTFCKKHKFPGRGQRFTPVIDAAGISLLKKLARQGKWESTNKLSLTSEFYFPRAEEQIVVVLCAAFSDAEPCPQFFCSGYRIDLYLAKYRIAVECDEYGHSRYCKKQEAKRTRTIKKALGCSFVRFDPYVVDFNLGAVIAEIRGLL